MNKYLSFLYPSMILSIPYNKLCEMGYYFCESMQKCILENNKCENENEINITYLKEDKNEIDITYLNEEKNNSLINPEGNRRLQIIGFYQDYDDRHVANKRLFIFVLVILGAGLAMWNSRRIKRLLR